MIGRFGGGPVNITANEGLVFTFLIVPSVAIIFGTGSFWGAFIYLFLICGSAVVYNLYTKSRESKSFENFTNLSFQLTNKRVTYISIARASGSVMDQYYISKVDYIGADTIRLHLKNISSSSKKTIDTVIQTITRDNFVELKVSETHLVCRFDSISIGVDLAKEYK